jgi:hypothetical protein
MSRAYHARVAASLTHHSKVDDGIEARLELLDIVGLERTAAHLSSLYVPAGRAIDPPLQASTAREVPDPGAGRVGWLEPRGGASRRARSPTPRSGCSRTTCCTRRTGTPRR